MSTNTIRTVALDSLYNSIHLLVVAYNQTDNVTVQQLTDLTSIYNHLCFSEDHLRLTTNDDDTLEILSCDPY